MKLVPIEVENLDFIRLDLTRHYLQIDCDFTCFIVLNPSGNIPTGGTDICALHVGAWQIDAWKFLTKDFAQVPGFSACLVWDRTLVTGLFKAPQVAESDIDTANSISSLKGQPVNITGFSMAEGESLPVKTLDNAFVSVKNYDVTSLRATHSVKLLKVGDSVDDFLQEIINRSIDIIELENSVNYRIMPRFVYIVPVSGMAWTILGTGTQGGNDFAFEYYGRNDYIDIKISDNLIQSVLFHYSGIVVNRSVSTSTSGYSFSVNTDVDIAKFGFI